MENICIVCTHTCLNTPWYRTELGCVCEDCYESSKDKKSNFEEWMDRNKNEKTQRSV